MLSKNYYIIYKQEKYQDMSGAFSKIMKSSLSFTLTTPTMQSNCLQTLQYQSFCNLITPSLHAQWKSRRNIKDKKQSKYLNRKYTYHYHLPLHKNNGQGKGMARSFSLRRLLNKQIQQPINLPKGTQQHKWMTKDEPFFFFVHCIKKSHWKGIQQRTVQ